MVMIPSSSQLQADNPRKQRISREVIGPAYIKLWHTGIRRLFNSCCSLYEVTPEELCVLLRTKLEGKGISPDDMQTLRELLLGENDLKEEEALRLANRYSGQTPVIDALSELIQEHQRTDE